MSAPVNPKGPAEPRPPRTYEGLKAVAAMLTPLAALTTAAAIYFGPMNTRPAAQVTADATVLAACINQHIPPARCPRPGAR